MADVNREGDPYLMKCLREQGTEVIWSNVLIDDKKVPHWIGNGEEHPDKGVNFQGEWFEGKKDADGKEIPISHPNARCTLRQRGDRQLQRGGRPRTPRACRSR